jgi:NADH-quinone oxidoreductase subunit L
VEITACAVVIGSTVMALIGLITTWGTAFYFQLFNWISVGSFSTAMDINYNSLASLMALMVTFVASIIHLYSVAFMRHDDDYARYFAYLNLFVFAMLVIALADNLFFYLGWEGVGFCSLPSSVLVYRSTNASAGRKAFVAHASAMSLSLPWLFSGTSAASP